MMLATIFQSTRPSRGATPPSPEPCPLPMYFNPRAPHGARRRGLPPAKRRCRRNFNPRAPCGARLPPTISSHRERIFQSTRPLRGATPGIPGRGGQQPMALNASSGGRRLRSWKKKVSFPCKIISSSTLKYAAAPTPSNPRRLSGEVSASQQKKKPRPKSRFLSLSRKW